MLFCLFFLLRTAMLVKTEWNLTSWCCLILRPEAVNSLRGKGRLTASFEILSVWHLSPSPSDYIISILMLSLHNSVMQACTDTVLICLYFCACVSLHLHVWRSWWDLWSVNTAILFSKESKWSITTCLLDFHFEKEENTRGDRWE